MWVGRDPSHRIDAYVLDTSFDRPVIAYDYGPHMDDVGLHIAYEQVLFDGNLDGKMCLRQNDPVGLTVCKHWDVKQSLLPSYCFKFLQIYQFLLLHLRE